MVHADRVCVSFVWWRFGVGDAGATRGARQRLVDSGAIQPSLYASRQRDDVFVRRSDFGGDLNLIVAADDGGEGSSFSAAVGIRLLVLFDWRCFRLRFVIFWRRS